MKLNKKAGLLTGGMLMLGAFYGPQASAAEFPLGVIAASSSYTTTDSASGPLSFIDTWDFQVSANASLNDSQSATGSTGGYVGGVDFTKLQLYDGSTLIATGALSSVVAFVIPAQTPITVTNYYESLNNIALNAGDSYTLKLYGDYLGAAGGAYTGTLATTPAAVSAVPLPSAAWFFLTATLGFLGFTRRKTTIG
jgi:hypothetical protein